MKLARHTTLNLIGLGAPLLFALATIPELIDQLGPERFGLLTIIWAVTSYFSLFDLGLSRSLTQHLAITLDQKNNSEVAPLCGSALLLMSIIGGLGGGLMILLAPFGVDFIKQVPDRTETINAVVAMGLAVPIIVVTAGLRGILEACHAFEAINIIRIPMGLWTFLGPLLVVTFWQTDLLLITLALIFGRVLAFLAHAWAVWCRLPQIRENLTPQRRWLSPLVTSGGWLTLSNLVSPFMGYVDRFVVGALISSAAIAYYATPQEIVTKLWIIPGALTAVLFPAFAAQIAKKDGTSWPLFDRAVAVIFLALLPVTATIALFSYEILNIWLGHEFAKESTALLQIFCFGILINCLAHIPLTWLHGAGKYKAPALLHCAELPFFLLCLWLFVNHWGLVGAASAWLLRMTLDSIFLFVLVHRERNLESLPNSSLKPIIWIGASVVTLLAFLGVFQSSLVWRIIWASVILLIASTFALRLKKLLR